jgi:Amidohydrolase
MHNFLVVVVTTLIAVFAPSAVQTQPLDPKSVELAKSVPIADVHSHTYIFNGVASADVVKRMSVNNVRWAGGVGDLRGDIADALGGRHIPAAGQREFAETFIRQGPTALVETENVYFRDLFRDAHDMFAKGIIKGFGELHTNNESSGPQPFRRKIKTDNPVIRKFYGIANEFGGFVQLHTQHNAEFTEDILRLSADFPNTTTILSHCLPLGQPEDLAYLFEQRKNIVCEMSAQGELHNRLARINRRGRVYDSNGIRPKWKALVEEFPDRIMLGSDTCCGWDAYYDEAIAEIRTNFLPYLRSDVIEQVAYKNALRIFKLDAGM